MYSVTLLSANGEARARYPAGELRSSYIHVPLSHCASHQTQNPTYEFDKSNLIESASFMVNDIDKYLHMSDVQGLYTIVTPDKFGQSAKFGQRPCLFSIVNIGIKSKRI